MVRKETRLEFAAPAETQYATCQMSLSSANSCRSTARQLVTATEHVCYTGAMRKTRSATTLFQKVWDATRICELEGDRALIHVDRHLLHDLSSPQAFSGLRSAGRIVRNAHLCVAVPDHV